MGGIKTFGHRTVYLDGAVTPILTAVRHRLRQIMSQDKHRQWTPHLILAMLLNPWEVQQMVEELRAGEWKNDRFTFPIHEFCLMQRGAEDPTWRCIAQYELIMSYS